MRPPVRLPGMQGMRPPGIMPPSTRSGASTQSGIVEFHRRAMSSWRVEGVVGPRVASFVVTEPKPGLVFIGCQNNDRRHFYAYLDFGNFGKDGLHAWGRRWNSPREETFFVELNEQSRVVDVTSKHDPKFWMRLWHRRFFVVGDDDDVTSSGREGRGA